MTWGEGNDDSTRGHPPWLPTPAELCSASHIPMFWQREQLQCISPDPARKPLRVTYHLLPRELEDPLHLLSCLGSVFLLLGVWTLSPC